MTDGGDFGPLQADRLAAQYFSQLFVDNLHHGLAGRQGGENALAVRPFPHPVDELPCDPEVDVGFEQRHAHVPHSGVHVLVGKAPLDGEAR